MMRKPEAPHSVNTAILLAAGRGKRLAPYTDDTPKPLLPYHGQPTLELIIRSLTDCGVTRLMVVTHYLEEQIIEFTRRYTGQSQSGADPQTQNMLEIKTVRQQNLSGTANAITEAINAKPDWFEHSFIVTATDYLVEPEFYTDLVRFHDSHNSEISISLKRVAPDSQTMRSSVRISPEMGISEVVEKPAPGSEPSPFTANLVYILPATIIRYLSVIEPTVRGELELQSAINLWLDEHGEAKGLLQATPLEWQPEFAATDSGTTLLE